MISRTRVASDSFTTTNSRRGEEGNRSKDDHAIINPSSSSPRKGNLSETNRHERDKQIHFESDTHTYTIIPSSLSAERSSKLPPTTSTVMSSVTEMFGSHFEEFDADKIIQKNYEKWSSPSSKSPYKGKTPDEIKKQWDDERDLGTELHEYIESWYNGITPNVNQLKKHPEWNQFLTFEKEQGSKITPYRTEWRIWSAKYRLAGTIDLVSKNNATTTTEAGESTTNTTYSLYDWKRTKHSIEKDAWSFRKYGKGPLRGVPDNHYNKYRLQLSLYKRILELHYNIKVSGLFVVRFHPNNTSGYQLVEVEDWPEYVNKLLTHRLKVIEQEEDLVEATTNIPSSSQKKEEESEKDEQETSVTGLEEALGDLKL